MQTKPRPIGNCERCNIEIAKKAKRKYCVKCRQAVDREISAKMVKQKQEKRTKKKQNNTLSSLTLHG